MTVGSSCLGRDISGLAEDLRVIVPNRVALRRGYVSEIHFLRGGEESLIMFSAVQLRRGGANGWLGRAEGSSTPRSSTYRYQRNMYLRNKPRGFGIYLERSEFGRGISEAVLLLALLLYTTYTLSFVFTPPRSTGI